VSRASSRASRDFEATSAGTSNLTYIGLAIT
jgi:hypothetical protein